MIVHHVIVIVCYNLSLYYSIGVPFLILSLLCEFNSTFLHARKLMSMCGYRLNNISYMIIWLNQWITFVTSRLLAHLWITYTIYNLGFDVWPQIWQGYVAFFGIFLFNFLNVGLMLQLWGVFLKEYSHMKMCWGFFYLLKKLAVFYFLILIICEHWLYTINHLQDVLFFFIFILIFIVLIIIIFLQNKNEKKNNLNLIFKILSLFKYYHYK